MKKDKHWGLLVWLFLSCLLWKLKFFVSCEQRTCTSSDKLDQWERIFEKTCISARPFNTCSLLYLPIMFRAAQQKSRPKSNYWKSYRQWCRGSSYSLVCCFIQGVVFVSLEQCNQNKQELMLSIQVYMSFEKLDSVYKSASRIKFTWNKITCFVSFTK